MAGSPRDQANSSYRPASFLQVDEGDWTTAYLLTQGRCASLRFLDRIVFVRRGCVRRVLHAPTCIWWHVWIGLLSGRRKEQPPQPLQVGSSFPP